MNNLNNKLKVLRSNSGMTQSELGIKLAVNPKVISKWEKGESLPSSDMLPAIADVFDISIDELFDRKHNKKLDIKNIVRNYGYEHAYSIPDIQLLFSYMVLGMQERDNSDSGYYSENDQKEISGDLVTLIENNDFRPQCHLINNECGIVNYLCDGFSISTMTYCGKEKFSELTESNYKKLRHFFGILSLEGAERLVNFFLNTNENISFTLEYLIEKTSTEKAVAKSFVDFLLSLCKHGGEVIIQKENAVLNGDETEIFTFYPGNETNMLRNVLLSAVLLLKDRGGYR